MSLFVVSVPLILYQIYGLAVPIVILAALYGFRWRAGLWGNSVTLGVILFSVLIALGWWEDIAYLLATQAPATLFLADNIAIWLLFIINLVILDTITRFMSTVKVKFNDTVESVGNGIVLFLLFMVLVRFVVIANGHLGMVGDHHDVVLNQSPATNAAIGALRVLSKGNLSGFSQVNQFDSSGNFLELQLQRRQALMLNMQGEGGSMQGTDSQVEKIQRRE